jgi:agmatinase
MTRNIREANAEFGAFYGIPTFMRQPVTRDTAGVDAVVMGIPYDSGAIGNRSGARFGPRNIREASLSLWGYHRLFRLNPVEQLSVVDYGDVHVNPADPTETAQSIRQAARDVLSGGATILALGGDHSITLPLLAAHAEKFGPLALVHFDAHLDTEDDAVNHGSVFRHAVRQGLIDVSAWLQIGIRGPMLYADDVVQSEQLGAKVLPIEECLEQGPEAVLKEIHGRVGSRPVYVTLDIDVVDPAFAPGTGTPEVGGFTSYQMLRLIRGLQGLHLIGMDLVEVCPPFDPADTTAILAANLVFECLSLMALRSRSVAGAERHNCMHPSA